MKRLIPCLLLLALAPAMHAAEFYVWPGGNDSNPGSAAKPFATLEKARDAARTAKGSKVILAPGLHRRKKTLELDARDSGTVFTGKEASIVGSIAIPNNAIKPVTDAATLARLLPEVRGKVMEINLRALGVTDFGDIGPRGFAHPYTVAPLELIVDNKALNLARWPNAGQPGEPMGKVLDKGSVPRNGDKSNRGGVFEFKTDRPARWAHAEDVWITGLFENGYADNTVKVKAFDLAKKTITTVQPHMYGFKSGAGWNRWTALNLLEEIDLPGEYVADKKSGKAYFLPPAGFDAAKCHIEATVLSEPLVAMEGAKGVVFDGVNFENARGMGVYIERGENCRIQNATMRNLGMVAVSIGKGVTADPGADYQIEGEGKPASRLIGTLYQYFYSHTAFNRDAGTGHGIINCSIFDIGAGAITLGGGDRKALTPAGNFVENCDIHDFNRWDRTYKGGVNIDGVGNRIAHCKIHECPAVAILLHGNDHVIEYNEITRAMLLGDDMGAFYMGRDPTERGNIIRYNYWHHLATHSSTGALYFDDSGGDCTQIYGNVFQRAGAGLGTIFIAGGSDFLAEHNLFIDCGRPFYPQGFRGAHFPLFKQRMEQVGWQSPAWTKRYPEFAGYIEAKRPRNNRLDNNLVVKQNDPRFVDGAAENFNLKPDADTGIPGFQPIPFDKIGLLDKSKKEAATTTVAAPAEVTTSASDQKLGLTTGGAGMWKFYPAANPDPALPRVLLIGDSICGGYRGAVIRDLKDRASVDVWLTPVAENDPGLPGDLERVLKQGPYSVVHFNIGLHGWPKGRIADGQYEPLMRKYVDVLRKNGPNTKFIWASSTPITISGKPAELDPVNNPTMTGRNTAAAKIMQESGITVNDLYSLVVEKRAQLAAGDQFHWKPGGSDLMAKQIVEFIAKALPAKP